MSKSRGAIRIPRFTGSGMGGGKKFVALLIASGVLLLVINDPVGVARVVTTVVNSVSTFLRGLRD